ncbi:hypothetical protein VroAM7_49300 (plasmid) [Vibrio rotiferianus]|uniref:VWFA domain-containing protein n=1 Tax=Vibrio rotiferianus TaxID=190895 RepID=A0A510IFE5_9VIBR|nr:VWA domain-containing protein [Vibrio rotiferianus]BBL92277.1 hypothetical protein VroAM7_49300 [Vibrio rotiferianus]
MRNCKNALQGSIQLILTALGGTFGYKVEFGAFQTASINFKEKKFCFPHLPLEVSEKDKLRLFGFVWHELSHGKYTTPEALDIVNPRAFSIFNTLEDVFIETKHNSYSDYAKMRMEGLTDILIEDGLLGQSSPDDKPASIFTSFLLNYGYAYVVKHKSSIPLAQNDEKVFEDTFGLPLLMKVKAIVKSCANSADSFENARAANHLLEIIQEEAKDRRKQAEKKQEGEPENGQGQQNKSPNSNGSNEPKNETSPLPKPNADNGTDDGKNADGSGGEGASGHQKIAEAIENMLSDKQLTESMDMRSTLEMKNLDAKQGKIFSYTPPNPPSIGSNRDITKYKVLPSLALQVKRSFESKNKRRIRATANGTRLHKKFPIAMAVGSTSIFRNKTETKAVNTHVSIAWDTSGSMESENRFIISQQAIISMVDAFEKTRGLTSSVCEFSGKYTNPVTALKLEHHKLEQVKGNFLTRAAAGTPTEYAQYWCLEQCLASKAKRKIVIIITDGKPNNSEHLPTMNKLCAQAGIEVYALGLKCRDVTKYWPNSMNINDIKDLPNQISNVVKA